MWACYRGTLVEKLEKGVRLTNQSTDSSDETSYFVQKHNLNLDNEKDYTLCIKVNRLEGSADIYTGVVKQDMVLGINTLTLKGSQIYDILFFRLRSKGAVVEIEYIDLFEGSIAYPHVKEDYAVALIRCMRYLQIIDITVPVLNNVIASFDFPLDMAGTPSYTYSNVFYGSQGTNLSKQFDNSKLFISGINNKKIIFNQGYYDGIVLLKVDMIFSCEPQ